MYRFMMTAAALGAALAAPGPSDAQATQYDVACRVADVSAFANRVHIRCAFDTPTNAILATYGQLGVSYFSVAASSPFAASFTTLGTAARQANRPLVITFLTSTGQNPPGCLASDCRAAIAARLIY